MRLKSFCLFPSIAMALSGCAVGTVVDVATAPVRGVAQVADWATTSQDEADRNRGRELREREERLGELSEDYERKSEDCLEGNDRACRDAVAMRREMDELIASLPQDLPEQRD
ncbi:hypothetical protein [Aurantiacibacter gangjinensis]|uniref:Uncharacterized protein n=2 Tax=Aurantiacibacter gangjinensis TaxID=502682 RepID=A0A0G9MLG0_9SPHN|nr:hypothetical protein [Aurantiacibacter gangjinensis]APE27529.1 hypothetical protein BMF35_a0700 [Aurantiacibacter gangjinensis]KLE31581.1 hypothetical protein AAW01_08470 [Aurantiacibacter gangjinensis]